VPAPGSAGRDRCLREDDHPRTPLLPFETLPPTACRSDLDAQVPWEAADRDGLGSSAVDNPPFGTRSLPHAASRRRSFLVRKCRALYSDDDARWRKVEALVHVPVDFQSSIWTVIVGRAEGQLGHFYGESAGGLFLKQKTSKNEIMPRTLSPWVDYTIVSPSI